MYNPIVGSVTDINISTNNKEDLSSYLCISFRIRILIFGFFFSFGFAALQLCVAVACLTIVAATPLYFVCSRLLNKIVTPKTCVIFPLCITILVVVMREII